MVLNTEMENETYRKWLSQLRKGYLELSVLTILSRKKSSYGFELLQIFNQSGLEMNEGTLYPLLNRMHKNGWLISNWETPVDGGHPRRFYHMSELGNRLLKEMNESYRQQYFALQKLQELT